MTFIHDHSTLVRLNALNITHVPQPRFIAPRKMANLCVVIYRPPNHVATFAGVYHVELWCSGHGLHPLERSPQTSTSLPHLCVSTNGPHFHQVPA